jgi:N6-adenosine-specific RNA methylase IME4
MSLHLTSCVRLHDEFDVVKADAARAGMNLAIIDALRHLNSCPNLPIEAIRAEGCLIYAVNAATRLRDGVRT